MPGPVVGPVDPPGGWVDRNPARPLHRRPRRGQVRGAASIQVGVGDRVGGEVGPVDPSGDRVDRQPVRAVDHPGRDRQVAAAASVQVGPGDRRPGAERRVAPVGPVDLPRRGVDRQAHRPEHRRIPRVQVLSPASIQVGVGDRVDVVVGPVDPVGGSSGGRAEEHGHGNAHESDPESAAPSRPRQPHHRLLNHEEPSIRTSVEYLHRQLQTITVLRRQFGR